MKSLCNTQGTNRDAVHHLEGVPETFAYKMVDRLAVMAFDLVGNAFAIGFFLWTFDKAFDEMLQS